MSLSFSLRLLVFLFEKKPQQYGLSARKQTKSHSIRLGSVAVGCRNARRYVRIARGDGGASRLTFA